MEILFSTKHLHITRFINEDLAPLRDYLGHKDNARWLVDDKWPPLTRLVEQQDYWAIRKRGEQQLIGHLLYRSDRYPNSWEIGWILDPQFQGQGFAFEVAQMAVEHAFVERDGFRVSARCMAENHHAWRLMERLGMAREAVFRQVLLREGQWHDEWHYALLKSDWEAQAAGFDY